MGSQLHVVKRLANHCRSEALHAKTYFFTPTVKEAPSNLSRATVPVKKSTPTRWSARCGSNIAALRRLREGCSKTVAKSGKVARDAGAGKYWGPSEAAKRRS